MILKISLLVIIALLGFTQGVRAHEPVDTHWLKFGDPICLSPSKGIRISFEAFHGFNYRVQHSPDQINWEDANAHDFQNYEFGSMPMNIRMPLQEGEADYIEYLSGERGKARELFIGLEFDYEGNPIVGDSKFYRIKKSIRDDLDEAPLEVGPSPEMRVTDALQFSFDTEYGYAYRIEHSADQVNWEALHSKNRLQQLHFFSESEVAGIIYGYGQRREVFLNEVTKTNNDTEYWKAKAREIRFYRVQRIRRPTVISSFPETGSMNVDAALTEITITFSQEMNAEFGNTDTSYDRNDGEFLKPSKSAQSFWQDDYDKPYYSRLWTRPIALLEPNTKYALWLNGDLTISPVGFKSYEDRRYDSFPFDLDNRPLMIKAMPYLLVFTTGPLETLGRRKQIPKTNH